MEYMGFGMQKWVYTRKPRKPYTFAGQNTGDTITKTTERNNILSEDSSEGTLILGSSLAKTRWGRFRKSLEIFMRIFCLLGLALFLLLLFSLLGSPVD